MRWRIELFFRWIKGHLRIKHYYGTTPNAVKTQIWIAVSLYLMVSIHPFEKVPVFELLKENTFSNLEALSHNQHTLWDL